VFRAALARLAAAGAVAVEGAWVRLPEHEVRLTAPDESLWSRLAPMIGGAERFRPPRVRDLGTALGVPEGDVRRVMKLLARRGDVHEIAQDHFFLKPVVAEIVGTAADLAARNPAGFNAAQLRDRLDNGRKVAIQILEFLDRHGVTIRRGDLRRMNRQRLDLFGPPGQAVIGREASPVGRPGFKPGRGRQTVFGGFDSHSLPPSTSGRHP
jgi:selenocysteine-specific elongation factor